MSDYLKTCDMKKSSSLSRKEWNRKHTEKLAYNIRTRAFFEALRRGLLNSDELEKPRAGGKSG